MLKRILAIHDLSSFGNASLMSVIPIMYRYGIQVTALPTALLSANTCYEHYEWLDTTDFMQGSIRHFIRLKREFSAIYSGFLGSAAQVQIVQEAIRDMATADTMVVIDPVMADDGKLYGCYDQNMVLAMRELIAEADLITPNFTEACLLAGFAYHRDYLIENLDLLCRKLCALGAKSLVITSVPAADGQGSRVLYYTLEMGLRFYDCEYIPAFYPGTGDIFCALLLALKLNGINIEEAIPRVTAFISEAIAFSVRSAEDTKEGVLLESLLWQKDLR